MRRRWKAPSVERWPIETMVVPWQPLLQQAVQRRLGGFVERRGRLVEEQIIRRVQQRARDGEPLLLAERQHAIPVRLLVEPRRPVPAGRPR